MKHQFNLIDLSLLPAPPNPPIWVLLLAVVSAATLFVTHFGYERGQLAKAMARPDAELVAGNEQAEPADPAYEARLRNVEKQEALRDGLARAADLPEGSSKLLGQLVAGLPAGMWFTELEISGRQGVRLSGGALDRAELALFASRLSEVSALRGLAMQAMQVDNEVDDSQGAEDEAPDGKPAVKLAPLRYSRFVMASADMAKDRGGKE